ATLHATNTVISDVGVPVARVGSNGGKADLTASYDAYGRSVVPNSSGPGTLAEDHVVTDAPRFVDPADGDFTPRADSPLVDAGAPGPVPVGPRGRAGGPAPPRGKGSRQGGRDPGRVGPPPRPALPPPRPRRAGACGARSGLAAARGAGRARHAARP